MAIFDILKKYYRVLALVLGLLIILIIILSKNLPQKKESENLNSTAIETSTGERSPTMNIFEITGQVNHPGVYEVREDLMVIELINLAGGFTSYADLEAIHKNIGLSKIVDSQEKVYIPGIFENSETNDSSPISGQKISLNNATLEQLDALPDIGESTANKIINARPFSKLEDLKNIEGIGDKTYNNIVSSITL